MLSNVALGCASLGAAVYSGGESRNKDGKVLKSPALTRSLIETVEELDALGLLNVAEDILIALVWPSGLNGVPSPRARHLALPEKRFAERKIVSTIMIGDASGVRNGP